MNYDAERSLELLRLGTALSDARFREGQEEAVQHVVEGRGRLLLVQKTGWGKSFVYFIAAKLMREAGAGPALLVSPLLALMRNQVMAAGRMGLRADTINSGNKEEWSAIEQRLLLDEVDILLISPERLANDHFRVEVLASIAERISLLVIDEAHCISDWGHDFRPHYRLIERIARTLPANLRLLATTATANDRVMDDLQAVLGPGLDVARGDLGRPSLQLQTMRLPSQAERLAWLAEQLPALPGNGIIYALTVRDARQVASWLQSRGLNVEPYTGKTGEHREKLEQALLENRVKALVATTALGMGFDKPDLAFVIHYQAPGSVVGYYQQVGRGGRALDAAYGVLLSGEEETEITDYFINSAFPTRDEVQQVIAALESADEGLSIHQLLAELNISRGRVEKTIALLSLESPAPIVKEGSRWQLTTSDLSAEFWERAQRLTELRREEQHRMQEYVDLKSGHMEFLIRELDGPPGEVHRPKLPALLSTIRPETVQEALAFLRRTDIRIELRKQWPPGGMPRYGVAGRIPAEHRGMPGRALCVWRDAGWGNLVRQGKYHDACFAQDLVEACVVLVRDWNPQPAPAWVTCIESLRRPRLVPVFAQQLAERLGLPFYSALARANDRPEQKTMANSAHQARNVDGSLIMASQPCPAGAVLLVDDMVDSGWTLTVGAWLLRSHGAGEVWPLALSHAGYTK